MAPFRLGVDELEHSLPWRLMQNGPVTKYRRRDSFDDDLGELRQDGLEVVQFDCASWSGDDDAFHDAMGRGFQLPDYYGRNMDALNDALADIAVPEQGGVVVALDNFTGDKANETLLSVLAGASRWWLLFGRLFAVVLRTDDAKYAGPSSLGATPPVWSNREWLDSKRSR